MQNPGPAQPWFPPNYYDQNQMAYQMQQQPYWQPQRYPTPYGQYPFGASPASRTLASQYAPVSSFASSRYN